jgi:hypothetical protein
MIDQSTIEGFNHYEYKWNKFWTSKILACRDASPFVLVSQTKTFYNKPGSDLYIFSFGTIYSNIEEAWAKSIVRN